MMEEIFDEINHVIEELTKDFVNEANIKLESENVDDIKAELEEKGYAIHAEKISNVMTLSLIDIVNKERISTAVVELELEEDGINVKMGILKEEGDD